MDVIVLEKDGANPSYLATDLVEGFSSKIWTERYSAPGEIELHTPLIDKTLAKIPERSLLSINQSAEVMLVYSRDIQQAEDGSAELVIKGSSLTGFTEHRHLDGKYQKKFQMTYNFSLTLPQAAQVLLWNAFVNDTGNDVLKDAPATKTKLDMIPNVVITDAVDTPGLNKRRWVTPGPLKDAVDGFLHAGRLGFRAQRPITTYGLYVNIMTVDHAGNNRGDITNTIKPLSNVKELRFDVYDGSDRTKGQTDRVPVIFSEIAGDLEAPDYFRATDEFKTLARVVSSEGAKEVARTAASKKLSGLDRRVIYVDGGSPDDDQNKAEFAEDLVDVGQKALAEHTRTSLISSDVSPLSRSLYRYHYYLGDKVTLQGKYGIDQDMYVTEFVFTEDAEGNERGYPGLTLPDDMDDSGIED